MSRISRVQKRKGSTSRVTLLLQCVTDCVIRERDCKRVVLQAICVHVRLPRMQFDKLESNNNYFSLCKNILLINTLYKEITCINNILIGVNGPENMKRKERIS